MNPIRTLSLASAFVVVACGGSSPPPETPSTPVAATADPAPSASPAVPAAEVKTVAPDPAPSAAPGPARAPATLDGTVAGSPFHAVAACVVGSGKDPGTVYLEIYSVKDFDVSQSCGRLSPDKDARKLGMVIAWKDGAQTDAAKLKGGNAPELFLMSGTGNPKKFDRKDTGKDFKPKGTISVIRAGGKKGDVARIKVDLDMGKDKLHGEVDVDLLGDLAQ